VTSERVYSRSPVQDNAPLSMWSNRWSTMPVHAAFEVAFPKPDDRAVLDRMPGSSVPVIRQPFRPGDLLPFWAFGAGGADHELYDLVEDPGETHSATGTPAEADAAEELRGASSSSTRPTSSWHASALRERPRHAGEGARTAAPVSMLVGESAQWVPARRVIRVLAVKRTT